MGHLTIQPTLLLQLSHSHQHCCLQSAERHIVVVIALFDLARADHRHRERVTRSVALTRQPLDRWTARIAEPQQTRHLVKRLAGGVIPGLTQQPVAAPIPHVKKQGVATGDEEGDERRLCTLVLQDRGE